MGGICGSRQAIRRVLVSTALVLLTSAFLSQPAFAQLPLGSTPSGAPSLGSTVSTLTEALSTGQVAEQAAPVVQQVAQPVARATTPVTQAAAPVVQEVAAPVTGTVAPVVKQAAPVIRDATSPILDAVAPVTRTAEPVVTAVQPLADAPAAPAAPPDTEANTPTVSETAAQAAPVGDTGRVATADSPAGDVFSSRSRDRRPVLGHSDRSPAPFAGPPPGRAHAPVSTIRSLPSQRASSAKAVEPGQPAPNGPRWPAGLLAAISAAFASSAALLLAAALAAAILLAAPRLGRRLRPIAAPWPLPIALPSLERPG